MTHARTHLRIAAVLFVACLGLGCSSSTKGKINTGNDVASAKPLGSGSQGTGDARCNSAIEGRQVSEYDTSGDEAPDVRKVFAEMGDGVTSRLVMICRESDINADGRKDVVRYYDDEGRSLREESDRNFDGKMDSITVYQNGQVMRVELDDNYDEKIDTKIYFDAGKPQRAERDLAGRSTPSEWRPDRWEYFEGGRMVRMGTDVDGDARVDHWDRDAAWKKAQDAANAAPAEGAPTAPAAAGT